MAAPKLLLLLLLLRAWLSSGNSSAFASAYRALGAFLMSICYQNSRSLPLICPAPHAVLTRAARRCFCATIRQDWSRGLRFTSGMCFTKVDAQCL